MANNKVNKDDLSFSSPEKNKEIDIERKIEEMANHIADMNKKSSEVNKLYDVLMNPSKSKVFSMILKNQDKTLRTLKERQVANNHDTNKLIKELNELKTQNRRLERDSSNGKKTTWVGQSSNYEDTDKALKMAFAAKKTYKGQALADVLSSSLGAEVSIGRNNELTVTKNGVTKTLNGLLGPNQAMGVSVVSTRKALESAGLIAKGKKEKTENAKFELSKQIRDKQREIDLSKKTSQLLDLGIKSQRAGIDMKAKAVSAALDGFVKVVRATGNALKSMGFDFANASKDILNIITNALSSSGIGSYAIGTSLFTNSSARTNQMKYGLSSSSNYAMMQTMSLLGMSSDDDLMYMNSNQREMFTALTNYYKARYNQLSRSGALQTLQKAQIDFQIFKQEMSYKFLNWFAKNQDKIMKLITSVMNVMEVTMPILIKIMTTIANVVSRIGGVFGSSSSSYLEGVSGTSINLSYTQNNNVGSVGTSQQLNDILNQNASIGAKTVAAELNGKY